MIVKPSKFGIGKDHILEPFIKQNIVIIKLSMWDEIRGLRKEKELINSDHYACLAALLHQCQSHC